MINIKKIVMIILVLIMTATITVPAFAISTDTSYSSNKTFYVQTYNGKVWGYPSITISAEAYSGVRTTITINKRDSKTGKFKFYKKDEITGNIKGTEKIKKIPLNDDNGIFEIKINVTNNSNVFTSTWKISNWQECKFGIDVINGKLIY